MLLFFLRHGDPIYDPDSLTPLGRRQAEALAKRLALYGIDEIYASSSERAQQTAQPTAELLKKEITILDWCNEKYAWRQLACRDENGGWKWAFQQPRYITLFRSPEITRLGKEWYTHEALKDMTLGEGIQRIRSEAFGWLAQFGFEYDDSINGYRFDKSAVGHVDRVALFAHQGFGLGFLSIILDIPYPTFSTTFDMGHTGMSVIEFPEHSDIVYPVMLQMANDSHLYRDGLPTNYQNRVIF